MYAKEESGGGLWTVRERVYRIENTNGISIALAQMSSYSSVNSKSMFPCCVSLMLLKDSTLTLHCVIKCRLKYFHILYDVKWRMTKEIMHDGTVVNILFQREATLPTQEFCHILLAICYMRIISR